MILKILVFEDDPEALKRIKSALGDISQDNQQRYGIEAISLDQACSKQEAFALLERTRREGRQPYVLLLDLRIPDKLGPGYTPKAKNGIAILRKARELDVVGEVLIYSIL